ncbi:MAG: DUF1835 domain-containing protein [Chlorobi bacterium]|nr:MAG: DUF1835 domain-containing protein [Bacteroidota bacterium]KXK34978.1 MAG: hypothetical protein UZ06_CHB003000801 [Chlorobi bacterium OLB6]MBE2265156.1 DUF1835 domain-containing protein [Flavobacteriales bacterium]MBL1161981.1 DUF1835 domain-containing protein [Chlorobiota bacterium]MBW7854496.1 DUF1835 domain-containing protein [Candidatus Kapabacteria bacterium]MCC6331773.1 DUF1835 domain-containing protein [Ignavibacteria bacterium]
MTLHITGGDILAGRLFNIDLDGKILSWKEALYEGHLSDYANVQESGRQAFNRNRATFISSRGWGDAEKVFRSMNNRDLLLLSPYWKEVVLWLEHDLSDQLCMAQVITLLQRSGRLHRLDVRYASAEKPFSYYTDSELHLFSQSPRAVTPTLANMYVSFWEYVCGSRHQQATYADHGVLHRAARQWELLQPADDGLSAFDRHVIEVVHKYNELRIDVLLQILNAENGYAAFWTEMLFVSRVHDLVQRTPALQTVDNIVKYSNQTVADA